MKRSSLVPNGESSVHSTPNTADNSSSKRRRSMRSLFRKSSKQPSSLVLTGGSLEISAAEATKSSSKKSHDGRSGGPLPRQSSLPSRILGNRTQSRRSSALLQVRKSSSQPQNLNTGFPIQTKTAPTMTATTGSSGATRQSSVRSFASKLVKHVRSSTSNREISTGESSEEISVPANNQGPLQQQQPMESPGGSAATPETRRSSYPSNRDMTPTADVGTDDDKTVQANGGKRRIYALLQNSSSKEALNSSDDFSASDIVYSPPRPLEGSVKKSRRVYQLLKSSSKNLLSSGSSHSHPQESENGITSRRMSLRQESGKGNSSRRRMSLRLEADKGSTRRMSKSGSIRGLYNKYLRNSSRDVVRELPPAVGYKDIAVPALSAPELSPVPKKALSETLIEKRIQNLKKRRAANPKTRFYDLLRSPSGLDEAAVEKFIDEFPTACRLQFKDDFGIYNFPLGIICGRLPSLQLVRKVFFAYPEAVSVQDESGCLPLHYACIWQAPPAVVKFLVSKYPESVQKKDNTDCLPLHSACSWQAPFEVVQLLVRKYPEGVRSSTKFGLPLHLACQRKASLRVVRYLIKKYPESIQIENRFGLPLHCACHHQASLEVVEYLIAKNPQVIQKKDPTGKSPLELAQSCGADPKVLALLEFISDNERWKLLETPKELDFAISDSKGVLAAAEAEIEICDHELQESTYTLQFLGNIHTAIREKEGYISDDDLPDDLDTEEPQVPRAGELTPPARDPSVASASPIKLDISRLEPLLLQDSAKILDLPSLACPKRAVLSKKESNVVEECEVGGQFQGIPNGICSSPGESPDSAGPVVEELADETSLNDQHADEEMSHSRSMDCKGEASLNDHPVDEEKSRTRSLDTTDAVNGSKDGSHLEDLPHSGISDQLDRQQPHHEKRDSLSLMDVFPQDRESSPSPNVVQSQNVPAVASCSQSAGCESMDDWSKEKKEAMAKHVEQGKQLFRMLRDPSAFDDAAICEIVDAFPSLCCVVYSIKYAGKFSKSLYPLSIICLRRPSLAILQKVYRANPKAALHTDETGLLPLHFACANQASLQVVHYLIMRQPNTIRATNKYGWLPLHYACRYQASREVVQYLVSRYKKGVEAANSFGGLPLHLACAWRAPIQVIDYLLVQYPEGIKTVERGGCLPLHLACANRACLKVVQHLLARYPQGAKATDRFGKSPLDLAKAFKATPDVVQLLEYMKTEKVQSIVSTKAGLSNAVAVCKEMLARPSWGASSSSRLEEAKKCVEFLEPLLFIIQGRENNPHALSVLENPQEDKKTTAIVFASETAQRKEGLSEPEMIDIVAGDPKNKVPNTQYTSVKIRSGDNIAMGKERNRRCWPSELKEDYDDDDDSLSAYFGSVGLYRRIVPCDDSSSSCSDEDSSCSADDYVRKPRVKEFNIFVPYDDTSSAESDTSSRSSMRQRLEEIRNSFHELGLSRHEHSVDMDHGSCEASLFDDTSTIATATLEEMFDVSRSLPGPQGPRSPGFPLDAPKERAFSSFRDMIENTDGVSLDSDNDQGLENDEKYWDGDLSTVLTQELLDADVAPRWPKRTRSNSDPTLGARSCETSASTTLEYSDCADEAPREPQRARSNSDPISWALSEHTTSTDFDIGRLNARLDKLQSEHPNGSTSFADDDSSTIATASLEATLYADHAPKWPTRARSNSDPDSRAFAVNEDSENSHSGRRSKRDQMRRSSECSSDDDASTIDTRTLVVAVNSSPALVRSGRETNGGQSCDANRKDHEDLEASACDDSSTTRTTTSGDGKADTGNSSDPSMDTECDQRERPEIHSSTAEHGPSARTVQSYDKEGATFLTKTSICSWKSQSSGSSYLDEISPLKKKTLDYERADCDEITARVENRTLDRGTNLGLPCSPVRSERDDGPDKDSTQTEENMDEEQTSRTGSPVEVVPTLAGARNREVSEGASDLSPKKPSRLPKGASIYHLEDIEDESTGLARDKECSERDRESSSVVNDLVVDHPNSEEATKGSQEHHLRSPVKSSEMCSGATEPPNENTVINQGKASREEDARDGAAQDSTASRELPGNHDHAGAGLGNKPGLEVSQAPLAVGVDQDVAPSAEPEQLSSVERRKTCDAAPKKPKRLAKGASLKFFETGEFGCDVFLNEHVTASQAQQSSKEAIEKDGAPRRPERQASEKPTLTEETLSDLDKARAESDGDPLSGKHAETSRTELGKSPTGAAGVFAELAGYNAENGRTTHTELRAIRIEAMAASKRLTRSSQKCRIAPRLNSGEPSSSSLTAAGELAAGNDNTPTVTPVLDGSPREARNKQAGLDHVLETRVATIDDVVPARRDSAIRAKSATVAATSPNFGSRSSSAERYLPQASEYGFRFGMRTDEKEFRLY